MTTTTAVDADWIVHAPPAGSDLYKPFSQGLLEKCGEGTDRGAEPVVAVNGACEGARQDVFGYPTTAIDPAIGLVERKTRSGAEIGRLRLGHDAIALVGR